MFLKGVFETMQQILNGKLMTFFQRIFAVFCVLMTDLCISFSFSILASKLPKKLIATILCFSISPRLCVKLFQPNQRKNLFLWRYSDTKQNLVPEPIS